MAVVLTTAVAAPAPTAAIAHRTGRALAIAVGVVLVTVLSVAPNRLPGVRRPLWT